MNKIVVLRKIKDKGFRITPARNAIVTVFSETKKPLNAMDVQNKLSKNKINVNKTTVYRELDFLVEEGFIKEVYIDPTKKHYESAKLDHHHHLVCSDCGKVEDVYLEKDLNETEKRLEEEKKFKIEKHSLEFFGLCFSCQ